MPKRETKLRRIGPGHYVTVDGRYAIERQDGLTECSHALCYDLHRRFLGSDSSHTVSYVAWHVWDNERDDYAATGRPEYPSKGDAHAALDALLRKGQDSLDTRASVRDNDDTTTKGNG